jgi:molecular chaperone GrpE
MMNKRDNKTLEEHNVASIKSARSKTSARKQAGRASNIKKLNNEIEKLTTELDEIKDKYLRTVAEFDNYKKRRSRDIADIIERANEQFCLDILPVIDDFERSLNSESKRKSYKSLKQGIELIYHKLIAVLKKQGVEPIASIGQNFNPEVHEAIMQIEHKEKPTNIVINEALKGYRLKDKVLRYSQVVVTK